MLRKRKQIVLFFSFSLILLFIFLVLSFVFTFSPPDIKHETNRWIIVWDDVGKRIAIEPTEESVWEELLLLKDNISWYSINGLVVPYNNFWHFHFDPSTIELMDSIRGMATIARITYNLDIYLYKATGINIQSIEFFDQKHPSFYLVIISSILFLLQSISISLFLAVTHKKAKKVRSLMTSLNEAHNSSNDLSLDKLSNKTALDKETIRQILTNEDLLNKMDLLLVDDTFFSKVIFYNNQLKVIESRIAMLSQFKQSKFTFQLYSELISFKHLLEEMEDYFALKEDSSYDLTLEKKLLLEINSLLDSITIEDLY